MAIEKQERTRDHHSSTESHHQNVSQGERGIAFVPPGYSTVDGQSAAAITGKAYGGRRKTLHSIIETQYFTHVVQYGDTLTAIANIYGTTIATIMSDNRIREENEIKVGQRIIIQKVTRPVMTMHIPGENVKLSNLFNGPYKLKAKVSLHHLMFYNELASLDDNIPRRFVVEIPENWLEEDNSYQSDWTEISFDIDTTIEYLAMMLNQSIENIYIANKGMIDKYWYLYEQTKGVSPKSTEFYMRPLMSGLPLLLPLKGQDVGLAPNTNSNDSNAAQDAPMDTLSFTYTVHKNDSLSTLANIYSTTVNSIRKLNPTINQDGLIHPKQKIRIPQIDTENLTLHFPGNNITLKDVLSGNTSLVGNKKLKLSMHHLASYNGLSGLNDTLKNNVLHIPKKWLSIDTTAYRHWEEYAFDSDKTLKSIAIETNQSLENIFVANKKLFAHLSPDTIKEVETTEDATLLQDIIVPGKIPLQLPKHSLRQMFNGYTPLERKQYANYLLSEDIPLTQEEIDWVNLVDKKAKLGYFRYLVPLNSNFAFITEVTGVSASTMINANPQKKVSRDKTRIDLPGKKNTGTTTDQRKWKNNGRFVEVSSFQYERTRRENIAKLPYDKTNRNFSSWNRQVAAPIAGDGHVLIRTCKAMLDGATDHAIFLRAKVVTHASNLLDVMEEALYDYQNSKIDFENNNNGAKNRDIIDFAIYDFVEGVEARDKYIDDINQKVENPRQYVEGLKSASENALMYRYTNGKISKLYRIVKVDGKSKYKHLTHWEYLQGIEKKPNPKPQKDKTPWIPLYEKWFGDTFQFTKPGIYKINLGSSLIKHSIKLGSTTISTFNLLPWVFEDEIRVDDELRIWSSGSFSGSIASATIPVLEKIIRTFNNSQVNLDYLKKQLSLLSKNWSLHNLVFEDINHYMATVFDYLQSYIFGLYQVFNMVFSEEKTVFILDTILVKPASDLLKDYLNYKKYNLLSVSRVKPTRVIMNKESTLLHKKMQNSKGLKRGAHKIGITYKHSNKTTSFSTKSLYLHRFSSETKGRKIEINALEISTHGDPSQEANGKFLDIQIPIPGIDALAKMQDVSLSSLRQIFSEKIITDLGMSSKKREAVLKNNIETQGKLSDLPLFSIPTNVLNTPEYLLHWRYKYVDRGDDQSGYQLQYFETAVQGGLKTTVKGPDVDKVIDKKVKNTVANFALKLASKVKINIGFGGRYPISDSLGKGTISYMLKMYSAIRHRTEYTEGEKGLKNKTWGEFKDDNKLIILNIIEQLGKEGSDIHAEALSYSKIKGVNIGAYLDLCHLFSRGKGVSKDYLYNKFEELFLWQIYSRSPQGYPKNSEADVFYEEDYPNLY